MTHVRDHRTALHAIVQKLHPLQLQDLKAEIALLHAGLAELAEYQLQEKEGQPEKVRLEPGRMK